MVLPDRNIWRDVFHRVKPRERLDCEEVVETGIAVKIFNNLLLYYDLYEEAVEREREFVVKKRRLPWRRDVGLTDNLGLGEDVVAVQQVVVTRDKQRRNVVFGLKKHKRKEAFTGIVVVCWDRIGNNSKTEVIGYKLRGKGEDQLPELIWYALMEDSQSLEEWGFVKISERATSGLDKSSRGLSDYDRDFIGGL